MPAFHALFLEWLELTSTEPAQQAAAAAAVVFNATAAAASPNVNATVAAAAPDLGEWLLLKGHNCTETFWGLAQPVLAASALKALKESYAAYCAAAGHPYDYWRRRRMGWWIGRLAAWAEGGGEDDEGDEGVGGAFGDD